MRTELQIIAIQWLQSVKEPKKGHRMKDSQSDKKMRNPAIELLRIIMLLQIVFLHVSDYGGFSKIANQLGGDRELTFWSIWLMCRCPVFVFIVIMGYYMCESKSGFNKKRLLKCYLPMLFYSVAIPVIYGIVYPKSITGVDYIRGFFPFLSRTWYFMTLYILVLMLSPFLNKMIEKLSRKEFLWLLAIIFFVFSVWQPLTMLEPFKEIVSLKKVVETVGGKSLYGFIYMYLLGAYMRKYHFLKFHEEDKGFLSGKWMYLITFIMLGLINTVLVYFYPDENIKQVIVYNDNPLVILQCVCIFRFFERTDLTRFGRTGRVINMISAGNMGIYMIHEHPLMRDVIWKRIFDINNVQFYTRKDYLLRILLIIIIIYAACWIIDRIVNIIPKLISKRKG